MAKLIPYHKITGLLLLLFIYCAGASAQYTLQVVPVDKDDAFVKDSLKIQTRFPGLQQCSSYINKLTRQLQSQGYPYASVDSINYDSTSAYCVLYIGAGLTYIRVNTDSVEESTLSAAGWNRRNKKPGTPDEIKKMQEGMLDYFEDNGYPFASIFLDEVRFDADTMLAFLKVDKGPAYRIDSIRNLGSASLSDGYLQQYLGLKNGSIYRESKLADVSKRIMELPFVYEKQPWNLSMLGTGSILNLYLETKKSSEVNVLIGLLPSNSQLDGNKMLITGEANINLRNSLGGGETIGLNWQQIQVKSPRLNVLFHQPYLFGSPFGMNFNFDLFKKDSSFVNVGILLGASYAVSAKQTGSVFIQRLTTNLLNVDTFTVKGSRRLPAEADVSSVNIGVSYEWFNTDYKFNPRSGNELAITASAGTKNIRKNNVIVKLYDVYEPEFDFNHLYDTFQLNSYQFRVNLRGARYFPLSRASTLKAGVNAGWFHSPSIFRNELFQVGGYKLLRGFDEESIFASAFGVVTAEYRYLLGQNSYLAAFMDYGATTNTSVSSGGKGSYLGAGLGMAFETKAGIFNITYAAGKRDDQKFNLRQSKIHLGYVNYF